MGEIPIVSIIVVNYNGSEHIIRCLASVCNDHADLATEILVVDNASTDNSLEIAKQVAAEYPIVRIINSATNRGYSGGINLGLTQAEGKYIAVLNMDTIVIKGWLEKPIEFLESNSHVGAVSPLLVLDDDENRINAIGQNIHVTGLGFNRGLWQPKSELDSSPIKVCGIHGAAFVIRKVILDQIGGMDESGFLYHEDVEISWLLQLMGYELWCLPSSTVKHKYFLTMSQNKLFLLERNRVAMILTNLELITFLYLGPLLLLTEFLMWAYCLLRGKKFLWAKFASYQWVFQRRRRIKKRRKWIRDIRNRTDWQVIRHLSFGYDWMQLIILGLEREASKRRPFGGIPAQLVEGASQD